MRRRARPSARARRHAVMACVVAAYLAAAAVVTALPPGAGRPRWLALHLLGLGAAGNAVLVWSQHFSQAFLHARPRSSRAVTARLVALNAGALGVLVGVQAHVVVLTATAAALVAAAFAAHAGALVAMARRHRAAGPFRPLVAYYVVAALALVLAAAAGTLLAGPWVAEAGSWHRRLHLAHAHLTLLGFVGLTVLGTEVALWPAVLRTRMTASAPVVARATLPACGGGLAVLCAGLLAGWRPAVLTGGALYALGTLLAVVPMARTARGRPPGSGSAWMLAASTGWLLAGVVVDTVRLAGTWDPERALRPLVPLLAVGLLAQAIVGALSFLLPVVLGRGPVGNRRMTTTLERGWAVRVTLANLGLLLVVLPGSDDLHLAGWSAVAVGLGSFLPLLGVALSGRATSTTAARRAGAAPGGRPRGGTTRGPSSGVGEPKAG